MFKQWSFLIVVPFSLDFSRDSVAPTRTTTKKVHRRVVNEVPNAAADEASEAPEGASTEASRRRAAWWCLRLKMAVSQKYGIPYPNIFQW